MLCLHWQNWILSIEVLIDQFKTKGVNIFEKIKKGGKTYDFSQNFQFSPIFTVTQGNS